MSSRTIVIETCDVCGTDSTNDTVTRHAELTVVFTTEQTEGRGIPPTLTTMRNIDLCAECRGRMIDRRELLTGSGAQGNNRYWFKEKP